MKISICIPGFLRTWEYGKPSFLKNLVQEHDCDLFVHTYKQNYFEYSAGKQDVVYTEEQILENFKDLNLKKIIIEDRTELFSVLEKESEKYKDITNYSVDIPESSGSKKDIKLGIRIYDQLRKMHLCNNLRKEYEIENNFKYDLYVKTRFDVMYIDKVNWNNFVEDDLVYIGNSGTAGFPDDLVGIGKEGPMNAYMDRFASLDKMCFTTVSKSDISTKNWYQHHGGNIFPVSQFCAHDTLLRNIVYEGYDIRDGGFRNMLIRNENSILNWRPTTINGVNVRASNVMNGWIYEGNNAPFDVSRFNESLT